MTSPTRNGFATIVKVGFTAPREGKKLASVTKRLGMISAVLLENRQMLKDIDAATDGVVKIEQTRPAAISKMLEF